MIFCVHAFTIRLESLSAGMLSGSLTLIILSSIKRISNGEPLNLGITVMLIKNLISGYVSEDKEIFTAQTIDSLINLNGENETEQLTYDLVSILKENSVNVLPDYEYRAVAKIIFRAVKALKTN